MAITTSEKSSSMEKEFDFRKKMKDLTKKMTIDNFFISAPERKL